MPIDGSALAEASLSYLHPFSGPQGPEVELLLVREAGDGERVSRRRKHIFQSRVANLWTTFGVKAKGEVEDGIPYLDILDEAQPEDVLMIVISTHGRTGPAKWRLGSVADKVIRDAPCPILVISPSCPPGPAKLRRILVPLDGSELAEIALPMAGGMAKNFGVIVGASKDRRAKLGHRGGSGTAGGLDVRIHGV